MNKTLANTVNNDIKIEVKTNDSMSAGKTVYDAFKQEVKDANVTANRGGS